MNKVIRAGALALALAAVLAAVTFFTVQTTPRAQQSAAASQAVASVLRQGSRGDTVRTVQSKLRRWGYYSGSVDGIYGPATERAVRAFQKKNGLAVDGIVGRATFKALGMPASSGSSGSSGGTAGGYTDADTYLLARCIYGEARGESYTGQVAVGAVVLNRVKSPEFPNTIAGVIYQKNAFTAVNDGQINLEPNETALSAARDAMNGWDPTGGCLYYYNPVTATSEWIFSRETVITIGNHVFAI